MKKATYIWAITLIIAGLMTTSAVSIHPESSEETPLLRELDLSAGYLSAEATKITMTEKFDGASPLNDGSTIIYDSEYDDFHPTVAGDSSGRFFAGFEMTQDEVDYFPNFWYSLDDGVTWDESGYFTESLGAEYADIDSNERGFYATFTAPPDTPGVTWVVDASDLTAITGYMVDWSPNGITDFFNPPGISCYTFEGEDFNEGGSAKTAYNGYDTADQDGCPFINYAMPGDSVAIGWLSDVENYVNADFAIDEITQMSYAVYDNSIDPNLLVRKDNFGIRNPQGFHAYVAAYDVGDSVTPIQNPSIEANDNTIIIVADSDDDVVCFYSSNGLTSVEQSTVESGASFPEVMLSPDGTFVCSYIKDGVLYTETSADGAVWADPEAVADNQVNDEFASHDLAKGLTGVFAIWEDTRSEDIDIYFSGGNVVEVPILEITSIEGGIGVTATVKNTGTGPATDVELTLTVTGGILKRINKNASATTATLAIDGELSVSSGIIFGLGAVEIVATATCAEGSSDELTVDGKQLIIFTKI